MRYRLEGENRAAGTGTGDSSTIEEASEVRWYVNAATGTNYTITVTKSDNTVIGSVRVNGTDSGVLVKNPTDKIYASNAAVLLSPVNTRVRT